MSADFFNTTLAQFTNTLNAWQPDILLIGARIIKGAAALGGIIVIIKSAGKNSVAEMFSELCFGFMKIGFCYAILSNVYPWATGILSIGTDMGQQISGQSTYSLTPSGIYGQGLALADALAKGSAAGLWMSHPINNAVAWLVINLVVPITWFGAAVIEFMVLLEAAFMIAIGPLLVGFAPMEISFPLLPRWIWTLFSLALKLMTIILILTVGMVLAKGWMTDFGSGDLLLAVVTSLLLFYCVWKLPGRVEGLAGVGSSALGLGEAFMGAVAGTAMGAAGSIATGSVGILAADTREALISIDNKIRQLVMK